MADIRHELRVRQTSHIGTSGSEWQANAQSDIPDDVPPDSCFSELFVIVFV